MLFLCFKSTHQCLIQRGPQKTDHLPLEECKVEYNIVCSLKVWVYTPLAIAYPASVKWGIPAVLLESLTCNSSAPHCVGLSRGGARIFIYGFPAYLQRCADGSNQM